MKSEEDFDDFIKSKFSNENDFPFEEDKWARMEEMIVHDETKRKRKKYFGFYMGGFISALIIIVPFYLIQTTERIVQKSHKRIETKKQFNQTQKNMTKQTQQDSIATSASNLDKLTSNTISSEKKTKFAATSKRNNKLTPSVLTKQKGRGITRSFQTFEPIFPQTNQTIEENKTSQEQNNESLKNFTKEENKEVTSLGKPSNVENSAALTKTNNQAIDSLIVKEKDTTVTALSKQDESAQINSTKENPAKTLSPPNKHAFLFRLGAVYNFGYSAKDGQSFSPYVGLTYLFKNKLAVGISYFQVNQLNFEKEYVQRSYDFGYRDKVTTIKQKNLQYLSIPIEYHYSFGKNEILTGISPVFLVLNKSEIRENERTRMTESAESTKNSYRYAYGLSTLDVQLSLGYSRSINNKISIGASFNYGLLDVRKNDWTAINKIENNKFFTLMLIYKLK